MQARSTGAERAGFPLSPPPTPVDYQLGDDGEDALCAFTARLVDDAAYVRGRTLWACWTPPEPDVPIGQRYRGCGSVRVRYLTRGGATVTLAWPIRGADSPEDLRATQAIALRTLRTIARTAGLRLRKEGGR